MTIVFLVLVVLGFLFEFLSTLPDTPPFTAVWCKRVSRLAWFLAALLWAIPGTGIRG